MQPNHQIRGLVHYENINTYFFVALPLFLFLNHILTIDLTPYFRKICHLDKKEISAINAFDCFIITQLNKS